MTNKDSNILWETLSSVKLILVLLILLAATSIIGTIIPQGDTAASFAKDISPALNRVFVTLQLYDMYHSFWFRGLIGLLTLNLIVCSINRFPGTMKRFNSLPKPDRIGPFRDLPEQRTILVRGDLSDVAGRVGEKIASLFSRMEKKQTEQGIFFYADKSRYSLFAVYLVHSSVLFILIGSIIGSILGFEGFVNIPEGEATDIIAIKGKNVNSRLDLDFSVRCKNFNVEFYEDGTPKEFRSELSFEVDGETQKEAQVIVNRPASFQGISFYQSSYGTVPGTHALLSVSEKSEDGVITEHAASDIKTGTIYPLPNGDGQFQIEAMDDNFKGMMGPAVQVTVMPMFGEKVTFWVLSNMEMLKLRFPPDMLESDMFNASAFAPYTFHLEELGSRFYTGLQVNRDPGVGFVWAGFILILIGLFTAFFTSFKRVWIRITPDGDEIRISVAGRASKNPIAMEKELGQLTRRLGKLFQ